MAGVRITHPTAASCRFTITDPTKPYRTPYHCTPPEFGGCGQVHLFKTHHLNVDALGSTIINHVLYEQVKAYLFAAGFRQANVVEKPPAQGVGMAPQVVGRGPWGNIPIVRAEGA